MSSEEIEDEESEESLEAMQISRRIRRLTNPFEYIGHVRLGLMLSWRVKNVSVVKNKACCSCLQRGHSYRKKILREFRGKAWRGDFIAIIGDGTAGKSCFLRFLAGKDVVGEPRGEVLVSSKKRTKEWFRRSCLIQSRTDFHDWLTVRETVLIAGLLKLPASITREVVYENVDKTLQITRLTEFKDVLVKDLPDHGISGGENTRLALAVELVTDPEVFFIDHELVGMSQESIRATLGDLRQLAMIDGRIVFLAISQHNLDIMDLFEKVLVLSQGQSLYYGSVHNAYRYFAHLGYGSPPEPSSTNYFLSLASYNLTSLDLRQSSQDRINDLILNWKRQRRQSSCPAKPKSLHIYIEECGMEAEALDELPQDTRPTGTKSRKTKWTRDRWKEFRILLERESMVRFRNVPYIMLTLVQPILLGFLIGFAYFQLGYDSVGITGRLKMLRILPKAAILLILLPVIHNIIEFRPVIHRERGGLAYHAISQYMTSFLASMPILLVYTIMYCFPVYYLPGLRTDGFQYFVAFVGILVIHMVATVSFALLLAGLIPKYEYAPIFVSTVLNISLVFLGGRPQPSWVLRWLQFIFPNYLAATGLMQNEFVGNPAFVDPSGEEILLVAGFGSPSMAWCIGGLLIQGTVYLFAGYFANERVTRPKFCLF